METIVEIIEKLVIERWSNEIEQEYVEWRRSGRNLLYQQILGKSYEEAFAIASDYYIKTIEYAAFIEISMNLLEGSLHIDNVRIQSLIDLVSKRTTVEDLSDLHAEVNREIGLRNKDNNLRGKLHNVMFAVQPINDDILKMICLSSIRREECQTI